MLSIQQKNIIMKRTWSSILEEDKANAKPRIKKMLPMRSKAEHALDDSKSVSNVIIFWCRVILS